MTGLYEHHLNEVQSHKWADMNVDELNKQLGILYDRLSAAIAIGNPNLIQGIQFGITTINAIINDKAGDEFQGIT